MSIHLETLNDNGEWELKGTVVSNQSFRFVFEKFMSALIRHNADLSRFRLIRK